MSEQAQGSKIAELIAAVVAELAEAKAQVQLEQVAVLDKAIFKLSLLRGETEDTEYVLRKAEDKIKELKDSLFSPSHTTALEERERKARFDTENLCKRALLRAIKERGTENAAGHYDEYLAQLYAEKGAKQP